MLWWGMISKHGCTALHKISFMGEWAVALQPFHLETYILLKTVVYFPITGSFNSEFRVGWERDLRLDDIGFVYLTDLRASLHNKSTRAMALHA